MEPIPYAAAPVAVQLPFKDKRPAMVWNLRSIFLRANLTEPEVRSLRGAVKALVQRRRDLEARGVKPGKKRPR